MKLQFKRFAWLGGLTVALCGGVLAGQKDTKAKTNPPASQAKTTQPATHFTQGTITSMDSDKLVLNRKGRGKAQQVTFMLNPQTQRYGNLATGTRVTVQYREDNNQRIAAAVREMAGKSASKPSKTKSGSKS
ncbi:MAG: hypothetical protein DMG13_01745 [Acidobacteria bacterium]|nr:MAG: hypothetical protein DMG13_01745 [Acidobacteriota bacterium]